MAFNGARDDKMLYSIRLGRINRI